MLNNIIESINLLESVFTDTVNYINSNVCCEECDKLTLDKISVYIENNHPDFEKKCKKLDEQLELFSRDKKKADNKQLLKGITIKFDDVNIDSMGYLCGCFLLKSSVLPYKSKFSLYDGVNFDININNYSSEEQFVLGTYCLC